MIVDMHCHILTEEMIRLMQGVSKTYAPILSTTDTPYPSDLTTSSQGFTITLPSRNATTTWPEGGHNVELRLARPEVARGNVLWYTVTLRNNRPVSLRATKEIAAQLCGLPGKDIEIDL